MIELTERQKMLLTNFDFDFALSRAEEKIFIIEKKINEAIVEYFKPKNADMFSIFLIDNKLLNLGMKIEFIEYLMDLYKEYLDEIPFVQYMQRIFFVRNGFANECLKRRNDNKGLKLKSATDQQEIDEKITIINEFGRTEIDYGAAFVIEIDYKYEDVVYELDVLQQILKIVNVE